MLILIYTFGFPDSDVSWLYFMTICLLFFMYEYLCVCVYEQNTCIYFCSPLLMEHIEYENKSPT